MGEYYYLRFQGIFGFFNVFIMFYAVYGTWEARASSKHTNLTRRIDPPTPKYLKSSKLKKSGFQNHIFGPDCYKIPFFSSFFEKVDLIWLLRPIPSVEKTRKWILYLWPSTLKSWIWMVFTSRSLIFWWKVDFHFKALEHGFSLCRVRTGLLYFQNMIVIFSEYILSP